MNRRALPMLLALLTIFIIGRIGVSFMQHEQQTFVLQQTGATPDIKVAAAVVDDSAMAVESDETLVLLGSLWIPSAEAAATMPIDEEQDDQSQNAQDAGALQAAREKMKRREKEVEERQVIAKEAEDRASKRIAELTALETRIQDLLDQEKSINDKKIKRLTAVYEGMKAAKAAPVIAQMDMDIVVKMFSRMNEKQVGKILSFLPPKQAVAISQALTKRIGSL